MLAVIIAWIAGITCFSLLGSWYARKFEKPDLLVVLYVTFILAAQVLASKISAFDLGFRTFFVPGGVLVFSVTFLLTDIVNERFGRKETHRMILLAFISQVAMVFFFWMGAQLPPAPFWTAQEAWGNIFGLVPRITLASWIAFLVSENMDTLVFSWFRKLTGGRHLWARNIFSSVPALALDSLIFVPIAFAGLAPLGPMIVGQLALKWLTCVVDVPFMYLNRRLFSGAVTAGVRRDA